MRKTEIIDRVAFEAMLATLDGDDQNLLRNRLYDYYGGETCEYVEVDLDPLGRIDSLSSPFPAD